MQYGCLKLVHFSKKSGRLSSTGSEILTFGSHCSANFQPILDCFIPKLKLEYDDLENIKTDSVNTVVFNLHQIKRLKFFGTPGIGVRLDLFYLTHDIFRTFRSSAVQFFPYSDHDGISFEFTPPNTPKRGPGYRKLNASILGEQTLQIQIKSFWSYWQIRKPDLENLNIWWDKGKLKMKDICRKFSINPAKAHKTSKNSWKKNSKLFY